MADFLRQLLLCSALMSVISLLYLALTPALAKRYSASALYLAWLMVLIGFLLPYRPQIVEPIVAVPVALERWEQPLRAQQPAMQGATDLPQVESDVTEASRGGVPSAERMEPQPVSGGKGLSITPAHLLFGAWVAGMLASFCIRLLAHIRFLRDIRRWGKPVADATGQAALAMAKAELGLKRQVSLWACSSIDSPMLVGILRPRILLPEIPLSQEALRLVLRHELVHLRRHDLLGRLLLLIASSVHWFNPVMIPVAKALSLQCETSCDAQVMRGMSFEGRKYYGHTILQSIRLMPARTTALSTRYHGGTKSMKTRIAQILDTRQRRIGALLMLTMFLLLLGTGAFALYAEDGVPRTDQARVERLNLRLARLLSGWQMMETIPDFDSQLRFTFSDVSADAYAQYMAEMDAAEQEDDVLRLVRAWDLAVPQPEEATIERMEAAFAAAGYPEHGDIHYAYTAYGQLDGGVGGRWFAWAPEWDGSDALVRMAMEGDGGVITIETDTIHFEGKNRLVYGEVGTRGARLAEEERAQTKARVIDFCREHMRVEGDIEAHMLLSDYAFQSDLADERHTYVWVFGTSYPLVDNYGPAAYREPNPFSINAGYQFSIGLDTGTIYNMSDVDEQDFVNWTYAQTDWVARTGLSFPRITDSSMWDSIVPRFTELMKQHMQAYEAYLEEETMVRAKHFLASVNQQSIPAEGWRDVVSDLEAVRRPEDFEAILRRAYPGVTESLEGEPTCEAVLALAQPALEALGYGGQKYSSALYSRLPEEYYVPGYAIFLANTSERVLPYESLSSNPDLQDMEDTDASRLWATVFVSLDGKVHGVTGTQRTFSSRTATPDEATMAETRAAVGRISSGHLPVKNVDLQALEITEMLESGDGQRIVTLKVPYGDKDEYTYFDKSASVRASMTMVLDLTSGRVIYLQLNPSILQAYDVLYDEPDWM